MANIATYHPSFLLISFLYCISILADCFGAQSKIARTSAPLGDIFRRRCTGRVLEVLLHARAVDPPASAGSNIFSRNFCTRPAISGEQRANQNHPATLFIYFIFAASINPNKSPLILILSFQNSKKSISLNKIDKYCFDQ